MADPEPCSLPPDPDVALSDESRRNAPSATLGGIDPGELFARGLQTVKFSGEQGTWEPPSIEEIRASLPEFDVTAFLASGGMGAVYRGVQRSLARAVALKILRPSLTIEKFSRDRFINEARITAQLDHPNIPAVHVLELDRAEFLNAFAMKLLEGRTLEHLLEESEQDRRDGLIPAIEVLLRICDAVAFAHEKGVLHLDIKPANIVVGSFGQIYLVDWGLARRKADLAEPADLRFIVEGTPAYMAPEQASGDLAKLDERTDIFGLGGVLYRILCGRDPRTAATTDEMLTLAANAAVTPPDVVAAETGRTVPRRLVGICLKALANDPRERYSRVQDFQQDLERFARGIGQLPQRSFRAGEAIIVEGEPGEAAFVIISGTCVATREVGGRTEELRRMHAGEMFGETAVFSRRPRSATVSALTDTVLGVVDQAALREEMERGSFMSMAIRTLTSTFLDLDTKLAQQRQQCQVIKLALGHVALHRGSGRIPWPPMLAMLTESTGATEADVTSWVLGAAGLALDGDTLVLAN